MTLNTLDFSLAGSNRKKHTNADSLKQEADKSTADAKNERKPITFKPAPKSAERDRAKSSELGMCLAHIEHIHFCRVENIFFKFIFKPIILNLPFAEKQSSETKEKPATEKRNAVILKRTSSKSTEKGSILQKPSISVVLVDCNLK